jgi:thioredoxin-related protein
MAMIKSIFKNRPMKRYFLLTTVSVLLFQLLHAEGSDSIYFHKNMASAMNEAKKSNKMIFVDAFATWCGPCKRMTDITFKDAEVISFVNEHFVCLKLDMERGEGIGFARKYQVAAYPTLLFTDQSGKMLHSDAGYKDADMFLELCRTALQPDERLAGLDEKFSNGQLAAESLLRYIEKRAILMNASQDKAVDAYLSLLPDWKQDAVMDFIMRYVSNPGSLGFRFLLDNKKSFVSRYGASAVNGRIENLLYEELTRGNHRSGIEAMEKNIRQVYSENAERLISRYKTTYYAAIFDAAAFMSATEFYIQTYPPEDPSEWADISYELCAITTHKPYLKKALGWVQEAHKKEDNFECRVAIAYLYKAMGKNNKARNAAKKAIAWARENGENPVPAEQFLSTME